MSNSDVVKLLDCIGDEGKVEPDQWESDVLSPISHVELQVMFHILCNCDSDIL